MLVQLLTMSSRSCRALSKPARFICKSYQVEVNRLFLFLSLSLSLQVKQIAKHSSCQRFIFCRPSVAKATEQQTCKANVLPLVRKLCNARTRSLRAIALEVVPFAGEDCAKLTIDRLPERTATGDMQLRKMCEILQSEDACATTLKTIRLSWRSRDDTNTD